MTIVPTTQTIRREPLLLACSVGPVAPAFAAAMLARQRELPHPAKLCRAAHGGLDLVAEVPCYGEWASAERRAENAVAQALAWLNGAPPGPRQDRAMPRVEEIQAAVGRWALPSTGEGAEQRIDARRAALACAVTATALPGGGLRLATAPAILRLADERCAAALAHFALEVNARIRFARLSVNLRAPGRARLDWDLVLDRDADLDRWLDTGVEALAIARLESERATRALVTVEVAVAYLATRREANPASEVCATERPPLSAAV